MWISGGLNFPILFSKYKSRISSLPVVLKDLKKADPRMWNLIFEILGKNFREKKADPRKIWKCSEKSGPSNKTAKRKRSGSNYGSLKVAKSAIFFNFERVEKKRTLDLKIQNLKYLEKISTKKADPRMQKRGAAHFSILGVITHKWCRNWKNALISLC